MDTNTSTTPIAVAPSLSQSAAVSIMERKTNGRPKLQRNMSSFSRAAASVEGNPNIDMSGALRSISLNESTKELVKEDIKLFRELKDESVPSSSDATAIPTSKVVNRYSLWECGFGMQMEAQTPSSIPSTKPEFLKAVKGELTTLSFIKAGLSRYIAVLNSGEHSVFSQTFLDTQNKSTEITLGQLDQIKEHLNEIVAELGEVDASEESPDASEAEVRMELQEVFEHAKPWIARTRAVMVSSHVFYKVNYALVADVKKQKN